MVKAEMLTRSMSVRALHGQALSPLLATAAMRTCEVLVQPGIAEQICTTISLYLCESDDVIQHPSLSLQEDHKIISSLSIFSTVSPNYISSNRQASNKHENVNGTMNGVHG